MTEKEIQELFQKFLTGTDQDKAEVREFITRPENRHLLYGREFTNVALRNAKALRALWSKGPRPQKTARSKNPHAMVNHGISACKSPSGISLRPVHGRTEVCLSIEGGKLSIRVWTDNSADDEGMEILVPIAPE